MCQILKECTVYPFLIAAATNNLKLGGFKHIIIHLDFWMSEVQNKSQVIKSRCSHGCIPSGGLICFMPFPASRGFLHSLVCGSLQQLYHYHLCFSHHNSFLLNSPASLLYEDYYEYIGITCMIQDIFYQSKHAKSLLLLRQHFQNFGD